MGRPRGVLIEDVNENSAADKAGIKRGDVVLGVNGQQTDDVGERFFLRLLIEYVL